MSRRRRRRSVELVYTCTTASRVIVIQRISLAFEFSVYIAYGIAFCVGQRIVLIHIPALLWYGRSYAKRNTEMFERK